MTGTAKFDCSGASHLAPEVARDLESAARSVLILKITTMSEPISARLGALLYQRKKGNGSVYCGESVRIARFFAFIFCALLMTLFLYVRDEFGR